MYNQMIEKLLSYPQRGQIQIDFDLNKRVFRFSVPIFSSKKLPSRVKEYAASRENFSFKPHATSYEIRGEEVVLVQEVPISLGFQVTSRIDFDQFWKLSRHCHQMLSEIAIAEVYKDALQILSKRSP